MITNQGKKVLNSKPTYNITTSTTYKSYCYIEENEIIDNQGTTVTLGSNEKFALFVTGYSADNTIPQALLKFKLAGLSSATIGTAANNTGAAYVDVGYRSTTPSESVTTLCPTLYDDIAAVNINDGKIYITVTNTYGIEAVINEIDLSFYLSKFNTSTSSSTTGGKYLHAVYHFNDVTIQPGETYAFKLQYPLN